MARALLPANERNAFYKATSKSVAFDLRTAPAFAKNTKGWATRKILQVGNKLDKM